MKSVLLYSHSEEPLTRVLLSQIKNLGTETIPLSLKEILDKVDIFDEIVKDRVKINWYLPSGECLSNGVNLFLINNVVSVPRSLFASFDEQDREYAMSEFRAYLTFAIESFPKSSARPGPFGLSGNRYSLPKQWKIIDSQKLEITTPKYTLGKLDRVPFSIEESVYSTPFDYYFWKRNLREIKQDNFSFCFERPQGSPVICSVFGERSVVFPHDKQTKLSNNQIKTISDLGTQISKLFGYASSESLFFLNHDKISFGMISNILYASQRKEWFNNEVLFYAQNMLMEHS